MKLSPGCHCCGSSCNVSVCFSVSDNCTPSVPVAGALVTLDDPSNTAIGTATTDGTGYCCIPITNVSLTGIYTYSIDCTGFSTLPATLSRPILWTSCTPSTQTKTASLNRLQGKICINTCQGVTVSLSQSGVSVGDPASAVVGSSGQVCFDDLPPGSVTATFTHPRIVTATQSIAVPTACGTNTVSVPTFTPASGYVNAFCCLPVKDHLVLNDPIYGLVTLTTPDGGTTWTGSTTAAWTGNFTGYGPACGNYSASCAGVTSVTIQYLLSGVTLNVSYFQVNPPCGFGSTQNPCPDAAGTLGNAVNASPTTVTCTTPGTLLIQCETNVTGCAQWIYPITATGGVTSCPLTFSITE